MADAKTRRDGPSVERELALVERLSAWPGRTRRDRPERIASTALVVTEVIVLIAALAYPLLRLAAPDAGLDAVVNLDGILCVGFALLWVHLGGSVLRALRRYLVLNRALNAVENDLRADNAKRS